MKTVQEITDEALRSEITRCLSLCNKSEIAGFDRFFPAGVAGIPSKDLGSTVQLMHRTLNYTGRKEPAP